MLPRWDFSDLGATNGKCECSHPIDTCLNHLSPGRHLGFINKFLHREKPCWNWNDDLSSTRILNQLFDATNNPFFSINPLYEIYLPTYWAKYSENCEKLTITNVYYNVYHIVTENQHWKKCMVMSTYFISGNFGMTQEIRNYYYAVK